MSIAEQTQSPAAWYPDHNDPNQLRWWNGYMWTDDVRPALGVVPSTPTPAAPAPMPSSLAASTPSSLAASTPRPSSPAPSSLAASAPTSAAPSAHSAYPTSPAPAASQQLWATALGQNQVADLDAARPSMAQAHLAPGSASGMDASGSEPADGPVPFARSLPRVTPFTGSTPVVDQPASYAHQSTAPQPITADFDPFNVPEDVLRSWAPPTVGTDRESVGVDLSSVDFSVWDAGTRAETTPGVTPQPAAPQLTAWEPAAAQPETAQSAASPKPSARAGRRAAAASGVVPQSSPGASSATGSFAQNEFAGIDFAASELAATDFALADETPTVWPFAAGATGSIGSIHSDRFAAQSTSSPASLDHPAVPPVTDQFRSVRPVVALSGPAQFDTAQSGPAQSGPVLSGPVLSGTAQPSQAATFPPAATPAAVPPPRSGAPLTRRQLRDMVGPLVVSGLDYDAPTA